MIESQQEAIVFISTSDCPYCRASIESLLKAAKDLNIDTIYYYDISNNQEDDEELKNKIGLNATLINPQYFMGQIILK